MEIKPMAREKKIISFFFYGNVWQKGHAHQPIVLNFEKLLTMKQRQHKNKKKYSHTEKLR